jgi:hypothetical protein
VILFRSVADKKKQRAKLAFAAAAEIFHLSFDISHLWIQLGSATGLVFFCLPKVPIRTRPGLSPEGSQIVAGGRSET